MSEKERWLHFYRDSQWLGPYTSEEKGRYLAEGKLLDSDYYWRKGWNTACRLVPVYYVRSGERWHGPYSRKEELKRGLMQGRFQNADYYWSTNYELKQLRELNPNLTLGKKAGLLVLLGSPCIPLYSLLGSFRYEHILTAFVVFVVSIILVISVAVPISVIRERRIKDLREKMRAEYCLCRSGKKNKDCCDPAVFQKILSANSCPCGSGNEFENCCRVQDCAASGTERISLPKAF